MIIIISDNQEMLSKQVLKQKGMTYGKFMSLLKKKNIKINNQKTSKDIMINVGDEIKIYGFDTVQKQNPIGVIYEDENIIVCDKPKGMQVKKEDALDNKLCVEDYFNATAVHRLDRNTQGILLLAKNSKAEKELIKAFKEHKIEKYYKVLVYGKFTLKHDVLNAYLLKDKEKGISKVFDTCVSKSEKIITEYKVVKELEGVSEIEVKLVTGKTHQIRAHMYHIHHSIVGDSKYQNKEYSQANKKIEKFIKNQCLKAYKIVFNFEKESCLYYLDKQKFEIESNFEKELKLLGINRI